jgi:O-antigen/teichoic acid export membrane protein
MNQPTQPLQPPWRSPLRGQRLLELARLGGYVCSAAVPALLAFFSIPLMIQAIGMEEFGRWSLLEPFFMFLPQLAVLGQNHGIVKQISADDAPPGQALVRHLACAQPVTGLVAIATCLLLNRLGYAWPEAVAFACLIYVEAALLLLLSALRGADHSLGYSVGTIVRSVTWMVVLGLASTGGLALNRAGDLFPWWVLASVLAMAASLLCLLARRRPDGPQALPAGAWALYRDGLRYGAPLLVTGLLALFMAYGGRFVLDLYADRATIAEFVIYLKITAVLNTLILTPFALWWPSERFRRMKAPAEAPRYFRRTAMAMQLALLIASGALYLGAGRLLGLFAPQLAFDARVMLPLVLATVLSGIAYALTPGLLEAGKTHVTIYINAVCALGQLGFCFLLIPPFGIVGAAWAAALCALLSLLVSAAWSHRLLPVPFDYLKMLALLLASAIGLFLLGRMAGDAPGPTLLAAVLYIVPLASMLAFTFRERPGTNLAPEAAPSAHRQEVS